MINTVRDTVMSILNKDNHGYITPDQFNLYARQAQLEIFEEYFELYASGTIKINTRAYGTGHANIQKRNEALIDKFTVPSFTLVPSGGGFFLPTDLYKINTVRYDDLTLAEQVSHDKIILLNSSDTTAPTLMWPAYTITGDYLQLYPAPSGALLNYVRYPASPRWTYVVAPGSDAPLFDQSSPSYQDFEIPASDEMNLILRILQMCGVTIREADVVQAAKAEELQQKQEE